MNRGGEKMALAEEMDLYAVEAIAEVLECLKETGTALGAGPRLLSFCTDSLGGRLLGLLSHGIPDRCCAAKTIVVPLVLSFRVVRQPTRTRDSIKVISRTTAMRYKGTKKPLDQIGRELSVEAIVEGSV
jgi:hypothetical protein